jgi:hypothetical protein
VIELGQDCQKGVATICLDEIGGWLRQIDRPYNAGLKETLTGAYEGRQELLKETAERAYLIPRPCLNIIGASTPVWLANNVSDSDMEGGFLGRWTFFIAMEKDYTLPLCDQPSEEARERLEQSHERLKKCHGEVTASKEAWDEYCRWAKRLHVTERLQSWETRMTNLVLKFAMLYALSERGMCQVQVGDVEKAAALVDVLMGDLASYVEWNLPQNEDEKLANKVYLIIKELGPQASHQDVLKKSRCYAKDFKEVIATLRDRGQVGVDVVKMERSTSTYYTAL